MKSRWVFRFQNLISHYSPSCISSLISPFKTRIHQNPFSETSALVLNHVDISLLLSLCGKNRHFQLGSSLHASIIKNPEFFESEIQDDYRNVLVVWNSLLSVYLKCGEARDAVKLFDEMRVKDTVSWNTMISAFLRSGESDIGFGYFKQMREFNFYRFDKATLTCIIASFDGLECFYLNKMMHCLVVLNGFERETAVGNALITCYCKCWCFGSASRVFDEMIERNVITWTAMISGLAQNKFYVESLKLFMEMRSGVLEPNSMTFLGSLMACSCLQALRVGRQIHGLVWKLGMQSDLCIESSLMDMYSKCGSVEDAWRIFESTEELDEVSMTVILVGFAQNGFENEAIQIFVKMMKAGIEIDPNMVSAVLGVFGVDTSLGLGKQLHSLILKKNFGYNSFVTNGLINMYSKCGELEDSAKVFSRMPQRNLISWNSMIAAFARHGDGSKALQLYEKMQMEGVRPTDVTFLSLLHACSHVGLIDPKGHLQTWNKANPLCNWTGITCHPQLLDRVIGLELIDMGLLGRISPFVSNLSLLTTLSLQSNGFHGSIPSSLGTLAELAFLNMSSNKLEGNIPGSLHGCQSLKVIDLTYNNLSGVIPEELGWVKNLTYLALAVNSISGALPSSLSNLTELTQLILAVNYFTGKIPPQLGALRRLEILNLHTNYLEGQIPAAIGNCTALREIMLLENLLSGEIPSDLFAKLKNMQRMYMSSNKLSGKIPVTLSNLSQLILFDVSLNNLEGEVPAGLGMLKNLENFYLHSNNLSGGSGFLTALTNCSYLQKLHLGSCLFTGHIPSSIGNLSKDLYYLNLLNNHITGSIPDSIGNLSGLVSLYLSSNHLEGKIPSSLGKLSSLQRLYLGNNRIIGPIPDNVGMMSSLGLLEFGNNSIGGSIPPSLGNLSQLRYLDRSC